MKYIDADRLRAEIEKRLKNTRDYMNGAGMKYKGPKHFKAQGKESAYDALLNIIDSLQQGQPDFPTTDEQMKEFLATHPKIEVPEKYKNPDWLFKKQEQPEEPVIDCHDLEEAANALLDALAKTPYNNKPITDAQIIVKQMLIFLSNPSDYNPDAINEKGTTELEDAAEEWAENEAYGKSDAEFEMAYKGFIAGAEWQREQDNYDVIFYKGMQYYHKQMMEEGIDCIVKEDAGGYPYIERTIELYDYEKDEPRAKKGDKYKLILIKNNGQSD